MCKWLGIAMSLVLAFTMVACSPTEPSEPEENAGSPDDVGIKIEPPEPAAVEVPAAPTLDAPATEPTPAPEVAPAVPAEPAAPAEPASPSDITAPATPAEPAAPAEPVPADPAAAPVLDGSATEGVAANKSGLVGPQWKYQDYVATFKDDDTLTIKVGETPMDGTYTLKDDGAIEINALGATLNGTWDGTSLKIDGKPLEKV